VETAVTGVADDVKNCVNSPGVAAGPAGVATTGVTTGVTTTGGTCTAGRRGISIVASGTLPTSLPIRDSSHRGNDEKFGKKSVTIANPAVSTASSTTRPLSPTGRRSRRRRKPSISDGPASSSRCTITTRPVDIS